MIERQRLLWGELLPGFSRSAGLRTATDSEQKAVGSIVIRDAVRGSSERQDRDRCAAAAAAAIDPHCII